MGQIITTMFDTCRRTYAQPVIQIDDENYTAAKNENDAGRTKFRAEKLPDAEIHFRTALTKIDLVKVDDEDEIKLVKKTKIDSFNYLAMVLKRMGTKQTLEEAVRQTTLALDMDFATDDQVTMLIQRGEAYMDLEDFQKAADDFKYGIELQKRYIFAEDNDLVEGDLQGELLRLKGIQRLHQVARRELMKDVPKVPVTILTGFLGSGKTTLLNRILKENHGKKIAVIENEFGAVGVDDQLVLENKHQGEAIVEVMNGCICCTVRQDLVETILEMKEKYIDTGKIDYIVIETTGMADPAPILQTFLLNDDIQEFAKIDSCLTICDSPSIVQRLEEDREEGCENEAVEQVCFADKIFLNKVDLCTREELDAATKKIREFNEKAVIDEVQFNNEELPLTKLLDLDMFSIERALEVDDGILEDEEQEHKHDSRIGTFSYKMASDVTMEGANRFIGTVLREKGANIYRMKGFLSIEGKDDKYVFHSVGMLFSCVPHIKWKPDEKRECLFVIIGKHLEQKWLEDMFKSAAVDPAAVETIKHKNLEENLEALKKKD